MTVAAAGLGIGTATSIPAFLLTALLGEAVPSLKEYGPWLWGGFMVLALPAALGAGLPRILAVILKPLPRRA